MKISDTATLGDGCNQLTVGWGCLKPGWRVRSTRPVGDAPAGLFIGRVLRDGLVARAPATCGVPVWGSAYGRRPGPDGYDQVLQVGE